MFAKLELCLFNINENIISEEKGPILKVIPCRGQPVHISVDFVV